MAKDVFAVGIIVLILIAAINVRSKEIHQNQTSLSAVGKYIYKFEPKNSSAVEINIVLDWIKDTQEFNKIVQYRNSGNQSEKNNIGVILAEVLNGNWSNKHLLLDLAQLSQNINFKISIFSILWRTMEPTKGVNNPFEVIALYQDIERIIPTNSAFKSSEISDIRSRIRTVITTRSAQILETFAYIPLHAENSNSVPEQLLHKLNELDENIYIKTLEKTYELVEDLVPVKQLAQTIGNFSISARQSVIANILLLNRLPANVPNIRSILTANLRSLVNNHEFGKLTPLWRARVFEFLPQSMRNLFEATKVCIRNATNNAKYLFECPQTYLMCTNTKQLNEAAFLVARNDNGQFAFRSLYWTNRYLRLEGNVTGNSTAYVKNVYSKQGLAYWNVQFHGDNVAISDMAMKLYVCGGNSNAWGDEQHAYTRRAADFSQYRQECIWYIEDCSSV